MDEQRTRTGLIYGVAAYGLWGFIPLYFKLMGHVSPWEVLAQRVVWSALLLSLFVTATRRWPEVGRALRTPRTCRALALSAALIALNWFSFIYAVTSGQVMQSSLGYFINPLFTVGLGVLFLGERFERFQVASLALAVAGVTNLVVAAGQLPWIALSLAISFAFYALIRKTVAADGLVGLMVETLLMLPIAAAYLLYLSLSGQTAFQSQSTSTIALLMLSGCVTAAPLLLFGGAARRLPMTTLGFLQYIAPSLQFVVAVAIFREPFSLPQLVSFACIWTAIAVYSLGTWRAERIRGLVRATAEAKLVEPELADCAGLR